MNCLPAAPGGGDVVDALLDAVLVDLVLQVGHLAVDLVQDGGAVAPGLAVALAGHGLGGDGGGRLARQEVEQLVEVDVVGRLVVVGGGGGGGVVQLGVELAGQLRELLQLLLGLAAMTRKNQDLFSVWGSKT